MIGPRAAAALVGVSLATLAACGGVPTSGPVIAGPVVDFAESTQFIRVVAAPPSPGATPAEVVRGFIEASASLEDDRAIARRYLTARAAGAWDPDASTTVFQRGTLSVTGTGATVRATLRVVGSVHDDGTLEILSPARPRVLTLEVRRVREPGARQSEWRIPDPPAGALVSDVDLGRAYRLHDVHFPSARSGVLVPDGRLIPVVGPSLPTTLAERVLAGPSEWLAPGVATAVPPGTALAVGAVPVTDGVAVVQVTEQVLAADQEQRADLAAQLTWTLTQLPQVRAVEIRVGEADLEIEGVAPQMDRATWRDRAPDRLSADPASASAAGADAGSTDGRPGTALGGVPGAPAHFLLDAGTIVRVAGGERRELARVPGARRASAFAVSLDARRAAVVVDGGRRLVLAGLDAAGAGQVAVAGTAITSVSFDADGQAWFVDAGGLRRVAVDGQVRDVPVTGELPGRRITGVRMARDGARAAVIAGGEVLVGTVQRMRGTLALGSLHRVDPVTTDVRDVAWRDAGTLDLLGTLPGSARQVLRVAVGSGQVAQAGAPPLPLEVAAAPGAPTLVASGRGTVHGNVGLQWRELGTARAVAYPG